MAWLDTSLCNAFLDEFAGPWYSGQVAEWRQCPGNQRTAYPEYIWATVPEHEWGVWIRWLLVGLSIFVLLFSGWGIWRYRQQPEKVYVYIAEGTGVSITICSRFYSGRKCQIATSGRQYPKLRRKLSGSLRGQRVSQSALKAAQSQANWQFENQSERSSTTGAYQSLPRCIWRRIWHKVEPQWHVTASLMK